MNKNVKLLGMIIFTIAICSTSLFAQKDSIKSVTPIHLGGPRIGFTYIFPGEFADKLKDDWGAEPFLTQFGWQFETRYFTLPTGEAGLLEAVIFIGGLEQNLVLPSGTFLIGYRSAKGIEFGAGPNLSLSGAAVAFAAGFNLHTEGINFPVNLALVPSSKGMKISLSIGFNARVQKNAGCSMLNSML